MESVQHAMVHDKSTTVRTINIPIITLFIRVLKPDPGHSQHAKGWCPSVNKSKEKATLVSDQVWDFARWTYTAPNIGKCSNVKRSYGSRSVILSPKKLHRSHSNEIGIQWKLGHMGPLTLLLAFQARETLVVLRMLISVKHCGVWVPSRQPLYSVW